MSTFGGFVAMDPMLRRSGGNPSEQRYPRAPSSRRLVVYVGAPRRVADIYDKSTGGGRRGSAPAGAEHPADDAAEEARRKKRAASAAEESDDQRAKLRKVEDGGKAAARPILPCF
jgi:hypothetical protein